MSSTGGSLSPDNVRLVLLPAQNFFLEIPIDLISDLCLNPRRYLAFLGWCILGEEGVLALDEDGDEIIDLDGGEINDGGTYYYVANTGTFLTMSSLLNAYI
jgi:hypothetical protein